MDFPPHILIDIKVGDKVRFLDNAEHKHRVGTIRRFNKTYIFVTCDGYDELCFRRKTGRAKGKTWIEMTECPYTLEMLQANVAEFLAEPTISDLLAKGAKIVLDIQQDFLTNPQTCGILPT